MRIQNLTLIFVVCLFASACSAKTQNSDTSVIRRSVTLTPGYMERTFNSNEMMKHGPLSLMQLYSKGTDALCDTSNNTFIKLGLFGLCLFPNYYIADTSHTVYHEFGHARAFASMGHSYSYYAASGQMFPTDYAYGIYIKRIENLSAFNSGAATESMSYISVLKRTPLSFLKRVMTPQNRLIDLLNQKLNRWWKNPKAVNPDTLTGMEKYVLTLFTLCHEKPSTSLVPTGSTYTSETEIEKTIDTFLNGRLSIKSIDEIKTSKDYKDYVILNLIRDELGIVVNFAGINNQMRYAQEVSNLIFKHNGHIMYGFEYMKGKYESYRYTSIYKNHIANNKILDGNDIYNILRDYDKRGYDIYASDIQIGSLISLFLSSTTWAFVYSAITELPKGSFLVRAPVWHGWRLPDLNFYMTSQGLSLEVVTGYQFNDRWYAGLTAEMVYKGNTAYEFSPSIAYQFNTLSGEFELSAEAIINNDMVFGGSIGIEWTTPRKDWTVGLKYTYHNALTFAGERNIPFFCAGLNSIGKPSHTNDEASFTVSYTY